MNLKNYLLSKGNGWPTFRAETKKLVVSGGRKRGCPEEMLSENYFSMATFMQGQKIVVTGAAGMVGQALVRYLRENQKLTNVVGLTRADCDLENRTQVHEKFQALKPEFVFHIAAKVGGIQANIADPVGFLQSNLLSEISVLEACHRVGVKKTLFLGSSCIYPRECPQPMKESYLLTGPLEPTNEGYALAKIAGLKLAEYYHRQFGMTVVCPMPCNVYGPGDSFDLQHSHVLSALVKRFVDAKAAGAAAVQLWGTGSARREFIYLDDLVRGVVFVMEKVETPEIVNLGTGQDQSIRELAETIRALVGYSGGIDWDPSKPDGMPRKCLDTSRLDAMGFRAQTSLSNGIKNMIADYRTRFL